MWSLNDVTTYEPICIHHMYDTRRFLSRYSDEASLGVLTTCHGIRLVPLL
jgi:hypothetical protein